MLDADARVAVELDGTQHLADPVAYRRDRRKDQLLQGSMTSLFPDINVSVALTYEGQGTKDTVSHDRIIGCPHEEGLDYPMGRACPQCSFWAVIDRFTHEPIAAPVAKMSPQEVLFELGKDRNTHPLEALESAIAHRAVLIQPLLQVLERWVADPDRASEEDAQVFCYALYLMAKWRETRAYPLVVQWLSLPEVASTTLSGDVLTQDGARILAAVSDRDLEPIKRLVQPHGRPEGP